MKAKNLNEGESWLPHQGKVADKSTNFVNFRILTDLGSRMASDVLIERTLANSRPKNVLIVRTLTDRL